LERRPLVALVALVMLSPALSGQDRPSELLRLEGVGPTGPRTSVTESFTTYKFIVQNLDTSPREARVVVYYPEQEDVQYARDVWVPAQAALTTWLPVGPAPKQSGKEGREIRMLLYDRTNGGERLILPSSQERIRQRAVLYRKRDLTTAIIREPRMVDLNPSEAECVRFSNVVRNVLDLPDRVTFISDRTLPPAAEAFHGTDVLILAGSQFDADPPGRAAIRRWVEQGGTLWVMLDQCKPESAAPILGDDFDLTLVDRVGLTSVTLKKASGEMGWGTRTEEVPVELVRVVPSPADKVTHTVDGWPAAFVRKVGRGKVLVTTLGPRGWYRERTANDRVPKGSQSERLPVENPLVSDLASTLYPSPETDAFPPDVFRPLIADEIGYQVVSRTTVALVLGGFVAALLAVGLGLRRARRPELYGWATPAVAALAAGVLIFSGERSRQVVPPTVATVQLVTPIAGSGEASATGLYSVFNPSSGPVVVGSNDGVMLDLDGEGLDGQLRRRLQTDTDAWRWEGLKLPAGVRTGTFRGVSRVGKLTALAKFGPDGLQGKLESASYTNPADGIALTTTREPTAVRIASDGTFAISPADVLPPGQYLAGAVLSDRQQRRQVVHQQLLSGKLPRFLEDRDLLFAWADSSAVPFTHSDGVRAVGTALLAVPIEFERTPPGTRVTIPAAFVPNRRQIDQIVTPVTRDATFPSSQRVRFQLPATVLPMRVEKVLFTARVTAPFRKVTVAGADGEKLTPLFAAVGPAAPIRVELSGASVAQPDARGGVYFQFDIGAATGGSADAPWKIESLGLEVVGTTGP
jgi:hypothetical protein